MSRPMFTSHYVDVLPMLGLAFVFLWLRLTGVCLRELFAQGALTVTGYLRRRPNPAAEHALRTAFATRSGPALVGALKRMAGAELAYALLMTIGLLLS